MDNRAGPKDESIKTPSFCLSIILLKENTVLERQSFISFFRVLFFSFVSIIFSSCTLSSITLMVLLGRTLVKRDVTSDEKYQ